ncbi:NPCBM/NEW2 domain-containing protein [Streptomyces sp. WAC08241]|uniref:NPCBM/NEW2 domain-containing protein n=1 Tax=Streptomyces sp. WAC08241 TaxID=2487421 RepID=UPI0026B102B3|nr:NPCBM/NEW2 domain-containing protein [Streptomyces sp. WAC08241]
MRVAVVDVAVELLEAPGVGVAVLAGALRPEAPLADEAGAVAAGDGTPISFGGTTYAKGLGVHAYSDVAFHLGGAADRFTTLVGIDDFSARQSSVGATRATVYGDDRVLHTTGVLTAATGPVPLDLDVRGVRVLRLEVTDANDKTSFDHTSWALARITVLR